MWFLLLGAIASLIGWMVLTFATSITSGAIHLLLAVGTTLLVGWYALRY
jgi:hypothetical protein